MVMWIDYEDTPVRYSDRLERIQSAMSDYQTTDDNSEVLRNGESRRSQYQPEGSASVTGAPHAIWGTVRPR